MLDGHEAEIEKIKNVFLAILRNMKKDIDSGEQPGDIATSAMIQAMWEDVKEHEQEWLSIDGLADIAARQVGKVTPMDEETTDMFRRLAKKMMKQAGRGTD